MVYFHKKTVIVFTILIVVLLLISVDLFGCRRRSRRQPDAQQQTQEVLPSQDITDPETQMWEMVKNSNNAQDVEEFLASYPNGKFARAANMKLKQLKRRQ